MYPLMASLCRCALSASTAWFALWMALSVQICEGGDIFDI